jgi:hypothetical protein
MQHNLRNTGLDFFPAGICSLTAAVRFSSLGKYWLWVASFRANFPTRSMGFNRGCRVARNQGAPHLDARPEKVAAIERGDSGRCRGSEPCAGGAPDGAEASPGMGGRGGRQKGVAAGSPMVRAEDSRLPTAPPTSAWERGPARAPRPREEPPSRPACHVAGNGLRPGSTHPCRGCGRGGGVFLYPWSVENPHPTGRSRASARPLP